MSSDNIVNKLPPDDSEAINECKTETDDLQINQNVETVPQNINRIHLNDEQIDEISIEELKTRWRQQEIYINYLESRINTYEGECSNLKESEEKLKSQIADLSLRERVLMRRLAAKEQDMQEYAGQLSEMKVPGGNVLKNALLDPAVNVLLQKLRQELAETRTRLEDTQNELSAWKFTPDSNTGKRLMAKCRLLYQENEELGAMISKGRLAKLEGELALQKSYSEEVKKSQSELDELLQDLDEDVEGMQSTIYYLQQELKKAKDSLAQLEQENIALKSTSTITTTAAAAAAVTGGTGNNGGRQTCDETIRSPSSPVQQQSSTSPTPSSAAITTAATATTTTTTTTTTATTTSNVNGLCTISHSKWGESGSGGGGSGGIESDSLDSPPPLTGGDNGSTGNGGGGVVREVSSSPPLHHHHHHHHQLRTNVQLDDDCVVNNNVDGARKRTSSEYSDDVNNSLIIKKARSDGQPSAQHHYDDQVIINGGNGAQ